MKQPGCQGDFELLSRVVDWPRMIRRPSPSAPCA
jgi:hypothetical protein